jgi:hypothetical protein
MKHEIGKLQFITLAHEKLSHSEQAIRAIRSGCRWVQLRMKETDDATIIAEAKQIFVFYCQFRKNFYHLAFSLKKNRLFLFLLINFSIKIFYCSSYSLSYLITYSLLIQMTIRTMCL